MNKQQREKRNEQMRQYKAEGHSMKEVAERFGLSKATVLSVCKGICPQSMRKCKNYRNQYTINSFDRIANCKRIIKRANANLEYIGGFISVDDFVYVRCLECGYEFKRSMITFRDLNKNQECPKCRKRKRNEEKQIRIQKIEEEKAKLRDRQKYLKKNFYQMEMNVCPICGDVFIKQSANQKYCSTECRNQSKWTMKDGYRLRFPLEELYQRDKGICYLCGKVCDWNDKEEVNGVVVYGNYYPSRDHIVPKSKGGQNSWENIKLAHRLCNSLKGDSPLCLKNA